MNGEKKINLAGLTLGKLKSLFIDLNEKPFRAGQVMKWIHQRGVTDIDMMSDVSKNLRQKLRDIAEIKLPRILDEITSVDGSRKWIIEVASGSQIETVFIPEAGRGTLCISSQSGCSLDCKFCATGKQGFDSNLSVAEIVGQLWWANKQLTNFSQTNAKRISNVVMMGMGEPLLNFDNVIDSVDIMMEDSAYGLSKRKVTISTSGVVPAINKMKGLTEASLAVSLHAPNDELRSQIMPINKKYPINVLLDSVRSYMESLSDKRVPLVEYTLIKGINDHRQHARDLAALLDSFPCKINIIPFNTFELSRYERPSSSSVSNFREILKKAGFTVTVRTTRADDIGAACGQLVGTVADRTKRSVRYRTAIDTSDKKVKFVGKLAAAAESI